MKTRLKNKNKNHSKKKTKKKNKEKNYQIRKTIHKQIEEEKEVKYQQEVVQPKIFNLPKKTLSRYQINILLHRLKFTPTPKHNIIQPKSDIITLENYV